MLAGELQILRAALVVGTGEHLAVRSEPLDAPRAVPRPAIGFPMRRIRSSEAEQDVLCGREIEVLAEDLENRNHHIQIEEEVQIDVGDAEVDGDAVAGERDPHALHIAAPKNADWRFAGRRVCAVGHALPFPVEHALHMARIPQRRFGLPEELDGPLLLLASDAGAYITGSIIFADGGHLVSSL